MLIQECIGPVDFVVMKIYCGCFFLLMLLCFIAVLIVTCYAHIFFTFIEF